MITSTTTRKQAANSIEEMQQVAHNQIKAKIGELEDRIKWLQQIDPLVESVVDWESYERAITDVGGYGDDKDLDALHELGEYYETMVAGNYFRRNDMVAKVKESMEYIRLFGHTITPTDDGNYFVRWVNCQCQTVDALELIELARRNFPKRDKMHINAISNGQGAPSTYLLVLAGEGKIPATCSITADTGWENDMLWSNGRRTTSRVYFEEVTKPLAESYGLQTFFVRTLDKHGQPYPDLQDVQYLGHMDIPMFGSEGGRYKQACTNKWKIRAIRQQLRRMGATSATTALGLTIEETHRMKESDVKWHQHVWPLIDLKMYRVMVCDKLLKHDIPWLISTECDGCPHKGASRWKRTSPEIIEELIELEARFDGDFFLTDQRIPLEKAIKNINTKQLSFFDSCDGGYCGV